MDRAEFEATEPIIDEMARLIDKFLDSEEAMPLRQALSDLNKVLGKDYSASLSFKVEVFDADGERILPLLDTGLVALDGNEPYRTWNDSSPQRYVVDGNVAVVPHDRCPRCWKPWDFKEIHQVCPHCDCRLGKDCKILLDSDKCPNCEDGSVSLSNPKCPQCGHEVDVRLVTWG